MDTPERSRQRARPAADCARVEDDEDTDTAQVEHDRLADKLPGTTSFLGERRRSLEAAQREHRELSVGMRGGRRTFS